MRHSLHDAIATAERRAKQHAPAWHPLLALAEESPGVWHMVDTTGRAYGVIALVRRGGELGYRATSSAEVEGDRVLVGYYRTLKGACEATHQYFIRGHSPGGHPRGLGG